MVTSRLHVSANRNFDESEENAEAQRPSELEVFRRKPFSVSPIDRNALCFLQLLGQSETLLFEIADDTS